MHADDLIRALSVLRQGRLVMVQDFIAKNPTIYRAAFRYENKPAALQISIDSYVIGWINRHWNLLDEMYPQRSATFDELFTDIGARLIRLCQIDGSKDVPQCSRELFFSLLENKSAVLNSMLEMSDRVDEKQSELRFSYERDNALFQRLMTECLEKEKRE